MNKGKIILAAVAVLAVAGGIFAFKADPTKRIFVPTTTLPTTLCPAAITGYTTVDNGTPTITLSAQTTATLPCTTLAVFTTN